MKPLTVRYYEALRRIKTLEQNYDELYDCWLAALGRLHHMEQKVLGAADVDPCERCVVLEDERDTALLQLDAVQATLYWLEKDFKAAG